MDCISIKDLEVFAHHGLLPEETILGQKFLVSTKLFLSTRQAGITDDIKCSIDYGNVCHLIKDIMENNTYKLIEALAEDIADHLLIDFPSVNSVEVEIKKPWAPILVSVDTVSVTITRSWHKVYLSIGSNMGDKKAFLDAAVEKLGKDPYAKNIKVSDYIATAPYGDVEQDDFLNGCVAIETIREPHELLALVNGMENQAGRVRDVHWGPRTLDIDILLYDDMIFSDSVLSIPHIDMCNREFVLQPLNQIAPYVIHPIYKQTISKLLEKLQGE